MKKINFILLGVFFLLSLNGYSQKTFQPNWESLDSRQNPAWFADAKFGIFIHWGLYSVPAWGPTDKEFKSDPGEDWQKKIAVRYAEWYWWRINSPQLKNDFGYDLFLEHQEKVYGKGSRYEDFVSGFTAQMFDPDQWAELFKNAGAKYVVLTSKHHEGFALWPSTQSWNWNAMDVGPHRDLLGDLTNSVKAKGLKMGYYYSLYEWFNPLFKPETIDRYVDEHMIPQMKDLVTRYKPDVLWGDGQWSYPSATWKMPQFMAWLFNESPVKESIVINDRWGNDTWGKHGGYFTVEYGLLADKMVGSNTISKPWEECKGIGYSFGYNKNENLEDYATSEQLVHDLITKVAAGGNLLLNIGPTAEGTIPVIMQQRLTDMGTWLKVNGEGIYGTRKWDNAPAITPKTTVFYTKKDNDLYLIVTKWQTNAIVIDGISKAETVNLIGYNSKVKFSVSGNKLTITPPSVSPADNPCQYAWVFKLKNTL